jgi:hypothetical protein
MKHPVITGDMSILKVHAHVEEPFPGTYSTLGGVLTRLNFPARGCNTRLGSAWTPSQICGPHHHLKYLSVTFRALQAAACFTQLFLKRDVRAATLRYLTFYVTGSLPAAMDDKRPLHGSERVIHVSRTWR